MGLLNKLGLSVSKKEREEKLRHGKSILIECGRDRVQLYINIFNIPRGSTLLVDLIDLPALDRRVKLPDVPKFMFDDYLTWVNNVEETAEKSSWGRIILLAHTTKVLRDDVAHDKALDSMCTKGLSLLYEPKLMLSRNDWNMLHLQLKAGDTRDEGMRQVINRLFKRSSFLVSKLEVSGQELADMGLKWEHVDAYAGPRPYEADFYSKERTLKAKNAGIFLDEEDEFHHATETEPAKILDETVLEEYGEVSISSLQTVHRNTDDVVGIETNTADGPTQDTQDIEPPTESETKGIHITLTEKHASQWPTAETMAPWTKDLVTTTTVDKKLGTAPTKVGAPVDAFQAPITVAEKLETGQGVPAPELIPSVKSKQEPPSVFTPKKELPRRPSGLQLPVHTPQVTPIPTKGSDINYVTVFSPRFEIPRTAPGSPTKTNSRTDRETKNETSTRVYLPPHLRRTATQQDAAPGWRSRKPAQRYQIPRPEPNEYHNRDQQARRLPNLKYGKSVLNTQRAKQAVWPGDNVSAANPPAMMSTNWREPRCPPITGDFKETKEVAADWAKFPRNFAIGAPPRAKGRPDNLMTFSLEKGVHFVDWDYQFGNKSEMRR